MSEKLINIDPGEIINTTQAARILDVSDREIRYKIQRGTLPAVKIGGAYLINRRAPYVYKKIREIRKKNNLDQSRTNKATLKEIYNIFTRSLLQWN